MTKEEIKESEILFKPQIDKLVIHLKKRNITSYNDDSNAYFEKDDMKLAISLKYLFRYSGICSILKPVGESAVEVIKVDNNMFYENYVKPTIDLYFKEL